MGVIANGGRRCLHRVPQIGHDHINARGQRFGLARFQIMGQAVDIWIAIGHIQPGRARHRPDPHHRRIAEIAKGLDVIGPLLRIAWTRGLGLVDQPVTDRIHHRLIFAHRIDD